MKKLLSFMACVLAVSVLVFGCGRRETAAESNFKKMEKKYGAVFNAKRIELKVLPIPEGSVPQEEGTNSIAWRSHDSSAKHGGKIAVYDSNGLVSETDRLTDGTDRLIITTTYAGGGTSVAKQTAALDVNGTIKEIPFTEAEAKMKSWGVK